MKTVHSTFVQTKRFAIAFIFCAACLATHAQTATTQDTTKYPTNFRDLYYITLTKALNVLPTMTIGSKVNVSPTDIQGGDFVVMDTSYHFVPNGGTIIGRPGTSKVLVRNYVRVNVKMFGAVGDGVTDNTTVFRLAAALKLPLYIPKGIFLVRKPITIYNDVIGEDRQSIVLWKDSVTLFKQGANRIRVYGIGASADTNTIITSSPRFIESNSFNYLTLENDSIVNARLVLQSTLLTASRGIKVVDCYMWMNFNRYTIETAQHDGITIQGYKGVLFDNDDITTINTHRGWKITAAIFPGAAATPADESYDSVTQASAEEITIQNCRLNSSSRVRFQYIDIYVGTVKFNITGNWFYVYGHSAILQDKTTQQNNTPFNAKVKDNHFKWSGTDDAAHPRSGLSFQGVYGKIGQVDSLYYNNCEISGNTFEDTNRLSKSFAIEVRFFHDAKIHDNSFVNSGLGKSNAFIKVGATQSCVVNNNTLYTGHIEVVNYTTNLNGDSFNVNKVSIKVLDNHINDCGGFSAGIYVSRLIQPKGVLDIRGNTISQVNDDTLSVAAIYLANDTLYEISIVNNTARMADSTKNKVRSANRSVTTYIESINSWQGSAVSLGGQSVGTDITIGTKDDYNLSFISSNQKFMNADIRGNIQIGRTVWDSLKMISMQMSSSNAVIGDNPTGIIMRNISSFANRVAGEIAFAGSVAGKVGVVAGMSGIITGSGPAGNYGDGVLWTKSTLSLSDTTYKEVLRWAANGSIGINNPTPNIRAALHIQGKYGILLPSVDRATFISATSKPNGLLAFDPATTKYYFYDSANNALKIIPDSTTLAGTYQKKIVLRTTGTGAATLIGDTLNIPTPSTSGNVTDYAETPYPDSATIAWTGTTPPSGADWLTYEATQAGKQVTATFHFKWAVAGSALTQVVFKIPDALPTPRTVSGYSATTDYEYSGFGGLKTSNTSLPSANMRIGVAFNNSAWRVFVAGSSAAYTDVVVTIVYKTN